MNCQLTVQSRRDVPVGAGLRQGAGGRVLQRERMRGVGKRRCMAAQAPQYPKGAQGQNEPNPDAAVAARREQNQLSLRGARSPAPSRSWRPMIKNRRRHESLTLYSFRSIPFEFANISPTRPA
jgi:hypothetical protein